MPGTNVCSGLHNCTEDSHSDGRAYFRLFALCDLIMYTESTYTAYLTMISSPFYKTRMALGGFNAVTRGL